MTKLVKFSGISAALILIILDITALVTSFTLGGINVFNTVVNNSIPCGLLLGCTVLSAIFEKYSKKVLSTITSILFSIALCIRVLAIGLYIWMIFFSHYLAPMTYTEYMDLAKYSAFTLLAVGVLFLMKYLTKGKFEKTTLVLGGVSCTALFVAWGIGIYNLVSSVVDLSYGFIEIFMEVYNSGLFREVFLVLAYVIVFWIINEINKEKEMKAA